ncbi:MAG: ABC transporter permease [Planctomycetota bacterium]|nr:ABC transporter permease [Planctomycetota bacterium]
MGTRDDNSVPALMAPPRRRDNPLTRSWLGLLGLAFLGLVFALCLGTLPYTLGLEDGVARYDAGSPKAWALPPFWAHASAEQAARLAEVTPAGAAAERYWLGTDLLGRSLLLRSLTGGGISLGIGLAAALISVVIGTAYGLVSGYVGGRVDALMMRIVDVLYGLPYVLLVVLLAVAGDALREEYIGRARERQEWIVQEYAREQASDAMAQRSQLVLALERDAATKKRLAERALAAVPPREIGPAAERAIGIVILLVAIGGVSWLTMARVIRGQVLSLKNQPFVEAARAVGVPTRGIFLRHLLPNLTAPIIVYATLTVPQAILQESFLSFLGIGVRPPLPSWGNLAADALSELNPYESNWWLLLFPCVLLGLTLLALNFVGEGLREAFDPKRSR